MHLPLSRGLALAALLSVPGLATCATKNTPAPKNTSTAPTATATAAARFLDQSTFGPTAASITQVEQFGIQGYLTQQFQLAPTYLPQFSLNVPAPCDSAETCWGGVFWNATLNAPDQVRQRVAFALSHIFVTSTDAVGGYAMVSYYNLLLKDAFANWRTLMGDVTLSPVMGSYLNMADSAAPAPGQIANENFARENLQLFNLGTVMLQPDGMPQLDATGKTIPAYTQAQVQGFAKAFTGWSFPPLATSTAPLQQFQADLHVYTTPLVAIQSLHDTSSKTLLNGTVLPAGQTAANDLKGALDNVFNHPNLPPFVCRQLIQHLVTSNPSPAYVQRVATVFQNDGHGVRGNLQAVVTAILTDSEARQGDTNPAFDGGHLREPVLFTANVMRALPYTPVDQTDPWGYWTVTWASGSAGESPLQAPSVFNFFSPSYVIPGTKLYGPEFGLETVGGVSSRKVLVDQLVYGMVAQFTLNLAGDTQLMSVANNPGALADELGFLFMHSQMPSQMRAVLVSTLTPLTDPAQRVRVALNIVLTSSQYKIIH